MMYNYDHLRLRILKLSSTLFNQKLVSRFLDFIWTHINLTFHSWKANNTCLGAFN